MFVSCIGVLFASLCCRFCLRFMSFHVISVFLFLSLFFLTRKPRFQGPQGLDPDKEERCPGDCGCLDMAIIRHNLWDNMTLKLWIFRVLTFSFNCSIAQACLSPLHSCHRGRTSHWQKLMVYKSEGWCPMKSLLSQVWRQVCSKPSEDRPFLRCTLSANNSHTIWKPLNQTFKRYAFDACKLLFWFKSVARGKIAAKIRPMRGQSGLVQQMVHVCQGSLELNLNRRTSLQPSYAKFLNLGHISRRLLEPPRKETQTRSPKLCIVGKTIQESTQHW